MKLKQLTGYLRDKTKKKCEIKRLTQLDGSVYFLHKMRRRSIKLEIQYVTYHRIPGGDILDGMLKLHTTIFGKSYDLVSRMEEKSGLIIDLALNHQQIVGYKIGYVIGTYTDKEGEAKTILEKEL